MMKLKRSKKAQFFSVLAILLIALMFLSVELFSFIHERSVIRSRVSTMDSFTKAIEDNLEKQIYISGFRILFLAQNYMVDEGKYLGQDSYYAGSEPVLKFFNESFLNGSVKGEEQIILFTYSDLQEDLQDKADKMNLIINLSDSPISINVSQSDPWNVNFSVSFNLTIRDRQNLARWDRLEVVSVLVPVTNFNDPIYNVETSNNVFRLIQRTPYETWGTSNLSDHVGTGYYSANTDSPSFLKRLVGDFSNDPNGIEGFVILPDMPSGFSFPGRSSVDHIYFSGGSGSSVTGMPSWFRIDDGHKTNYEIS